MVNLPDFEWLPGIREEQEIIGERRTSDRESASKDLMDADSRRADDRGRKA
jgi:hypothetical protein